MSEQTLACRSGQEKPLPFLLDFDRPRLTEALAELGAPTYRSEQLWRWLHCRCATSYDVMSDLPLPLRQALAARYTLRRFCVAAHRISADGLTEKWRLLVAGPSPQPQAPGAETVLIREKRGTRRTVCVSCMIGCPVGCAFCATGACGFHRHLSRGEIIEQVYRAEEKVRQTDAAHISHVVFMGMGEPLLNYDEVVAAVALLADPRGLGLSRRHLTLSTVGIPAGIRRLAAEHPDVRLSVSLHAGTQETRDRLIPFAQRWPLAEIMASIREFAKVARRRVTIEYCLIDGVNARQTDAQALAVLLRTVPCKVNLIPYNPVDAYAGQPPSATRVSAFRAILLRRGIPTTIRVEKGGEIGAACGQLKPHH